MTKIIMDTNALFAGLYSASGASYKVLQHLAAGHLQMVLSTPLLFEYESAVAEKVSAIATEEYLQAQAQRADKTAFESILAKVANRYRGMSCS